jgi:hypothetical protein
MLLQLLQLRLALYTLTVLLQVLLLVLLQVHPAVQQGV